jgi:hypothetical protein
MTEPIQISIDIARRFVLGKQGLWPGRRWRGKRGTEQAMRAMEHLQLDPLQIFARSQDIKLHSRVIDYTPGLWEELAYTDRKFFDWGGWLAVRPMDELPYWRTLMRRERESRQWIDHIKPHRAAVEEMRQLLRQRETVRNRDFAMKDRTRTHNYRGRKDSAIALYYLWRTGEVMVHHRERFERVYALTEHIAPAQLICECSDAEADDFLIKKEISFWGLFKFNGINVVLQRTLSRTEVKQLIESLLRKDDIVPVRVEGWKDIHYALAADVKLLRELSAGRIPKSWQPLETTTQDEVLFLAPLDIVSARGRAKILFDFEYKWEVYEPLHRRKWGYYTLPILWGDDLVARLDLKLDRATNTLVICGFWLEEARTGKDAAFAEALARGVARCLKFVGAERLDAKAIHPPALRKRVQHGERDL